MADSLKYTSKVGKGIPKISDSPLVPLETQECEKRGPPCTCACTLVSIPSRKTTTTTTNKQTNKQTKTTKRWINLHSSSQIPTAARFWSRFGGVSEGGNIVCATAPKFVQNILDVMGK